LIPAAALGLLAGCQPSPPPTPPPAPPAKSPAVPEAAAKGSETMVMTLTSPAFGEGQAIGAKHGYRNQNLSPALAWGEPPAGTKSLALLVDDPDAPAGDWVHWVLFNLPATARGLTEGVAKEAQRADGSRQGKNDFGNLGWDGPAPPSGTHHYHFKLYALDASLSLAAGATKKDLLAAIAGHELGRAELVGTFSK